MSYNLLLDTNFSNVKKHWKLTNCEYKDGYLIGNSKIYSLEQDITVAALTKLYFRVNYLNFDSNIKKIYCGILSEGEFKATRIKPKKQKKDIISVVSTIKSNKTIKVKIIIEAKKENTKICITNPLMVDLKNQGKENWPKKILDFYLDYKYGYFYTNIYPQSEIMLNSEDFKSPYIETQQGKVGIITKNTETEWFRLNTKFEKDHFYLVKINYEEINSYGKIYLNYGEFNSIPTNDTTQVHLVFRHDGVSDFKIYLMNENLLPYIVNLKHIMVVDITNQRFDENDIHQLPFI